MKFGVMEMQMGLLLPPPGTGLQELGLHMQTFDHIRILSRVYESGFRLVELGGDLVLFFPNIYKPASMEKLARYVEEQKIDLTVHLPLWSVESSTPSDPIRDGSVRQLIEVVRAVKPLNPISYVLHATGMLAAEFYTMTLPDYARGVLMRLFQSKAAESVARILGETGVESRKIAIETIQFPLDLTLELAEMFDTSICLDVGHVLSGFSGPTSLFDAMEMILPRLGEVHLHDSPIHQPGTPLVYGKDHQTLGKGELDVSRFLDHLEEAGWDGPVIFELKIDEAVESVEVVRRSHPHLLA